MFGDCILERWDEMMADLREIISIPSYKGEPQPGMPLGKGPHDALVWFLKRAAEMGFSTYNAQEKAGHAEWGTGAEYAAVVAHFDVVPPGEGWKTDPFTLTEKKRYFICQRDCG